MALWVQTIRGWIVGALIRMVHKVIEQTTGELFELRRQRSICQVRHERSQPSHQFSSFTTTSAMISA